MRTGVFFPHLTSRRLRDYPEALAGVLENDSVFYYDAFYPGKAPSEFDLDPFPEEWLLDVHTAEMVERVKATGMFEGALFSAAGTVAASARIWNGEIDNAFVFTGSGDHHAGRDFFGGGCYLNGAAVAVRRLRAESGLGRVAIVDTDAHHGDGTWDVFRDDPETLYACLCTGPDREEGTNVNVRVSPPVSDEEYVSLVRERVAPLIERFEPELLYWNWGYDGTCGDYGDMGISPECHLELARVLRGLAGRVCSGRLIVVMCGGLHQVVTREIIPRMILTLADG